MDSNTIGTGNTAVGANALQNSTGNNNIAIGNQAGLGLTTGSDNIYIGTQGSDTSNTIRIGTGQTATYIAGIWNTGGTGNTVYANSSGQLFTLPSARRYKQDIRDLGDTTDEVMGLRPVRFRYKAQGQEGPEQYRLIAEEVDEVAPELVARGKDEQIDSVYYDRVNIMLLNEVQKQNQHAQQQDDTIKQQKEQIQKLEARLAALEALLSGKATTTATAGQ